MDNKQLCEDLAAEIRTIIHEAESLRSLTEIQFNQKRKDGGWSVAQVLTHLNFYSAFYLPHLERVIAEHEGNSIHFSSGWLGRYFTKLMRPDGRGDVSKKMKAPGNATPTDTHYKMMVLDTFIADQHRLLHLLKQSGNANLNVRVPISISKLIRLKAGDTYQFLVAHEQRHFVQISRLLKEIS